MPSLSVVQTVPSWRRKDAPGALLAAEAERAVEQAVDEPLEADRHLAQAAAQVRRPPGRSSSWRPASCRRPRRARQPGRLLEQVPDRDRQVVVGVHQPGAAA